jgi:hypothetical protein
MVLACAIMVGCSKQGKDETPIVHETCVKVLYHKTGDEQFFCHTTARFSEIELCKEWENAQRQNNPAIPAGTMKTNCK